jgi:hypothetical protein
MIGVVPALMLLVAASLGYGGLILRLAGVQDRFEARLRWPLAMALGYGSIGALVFPLALAGGAAPLPLALLLLVGLGGFVYLGPPPSPAWPATRPGRVLLAAALIAALALLVIGLAPPTDADSLAYHFTRPLRVLAEGRLRFEPVAVEGAIPLLVQMTYLPALALGGEQAMTLWAALGGAAPAWLLFAYARRWLTPSAAGALALALATTPAMVFGLGSGQVEPRAALFVLAGVIALAELQARRETGFTLVAGLAFGFFAGAKYYGLFAAAIAFLILLTIERRPRGLLLFALAGLAAGLPPYVWNWLESGDPVFPALWSILGRADTEFWNAVHNEYFLRYYYGSERPVAVGLGWLLAYPFAATVNGLPGWESGRTGLGLLPLLLLPFALAGLLRRGPGWVRSPLALAGGLAALFYGIWFVLGASQRIRHLVPVLPLVLLGLWVAAERGGAWIEGWRMPLVVGLGAVLVVQMGGLALYALKPIRYAAGSTDREAYLGANVAFYAPVPWINAHLGPRDRLLFFERQLAYYLTVPTYYGSTAYQARLDLTPDIPDDQGKRLRQLRALGITHMLMIPSLAESGLDDPRPRLAAALVNAGCARAAHRTKAHWPRSRTLGGGLIFEAEILALDLGACDETRLAAGLPKAAGAATTPRPSDQGEIQ